MRMATSLGSIAVVPAWWKLRAAWQRRLQDCASAVTADLLENCLTTRSALPSMAQLLADMGAAFKQPATLASANMLGLKAFFCGSWRSNRTLLALVALSFDGSSLTRTASLVASVPTTAQVGSARAHALRRLNLALMADGLRCRPPATAVDIDRLHAWETVASMTFRLASVPTR